MKTLELTFSELGTLKLALDCQRKELERLKVWLEEQGKDAEIYINELKVLNDLSCRIKELNKI